MTYKALVVVCLAAIAFVALRYEARQKAIENQQAARQRAEDEAEAKRRAAGAEQRAAEAEQRAADEAAAKALERDWLVMEAQANAYENGKLGVTYDHIRAADVRDAISKEQRFAGVKSAEVRRKIIQARTTYRPLSRGYGGIEGEPPPPSRGL